MQRYKTCYKGIKSRKKGGVQMIILIILSAVLAVGILFSLYCMIKVASEIDEEQEK